MTSLKPFMVWATVSSKIPNRLKDTHWRLLLTHLVTMGAILGVSVTVVYIFFAQSRSQQLNVRLLTLVQAAAPSLHTVETEGRQRLDSDLPWRSLFYNQEQGIEWFNAKGELLSREGSNFSKTPLPEQLASFHGSRSAPVIEYQDQLRVATIVVYDRSPDGKTLILKGYLRASQSTQRLEIALLQLRLGLAAGGTLALLLTSISSFHLTHQAVKPLKQSIQRLTQFSADAVQELRNPLTKISTATELMLSHPEQIDPADVKKLLAIANATEQMRMLIDDVLFLTRTDAAHIPTEGQTTVPLDQLLRTIVERFKSEARLRGINVQDQLPADVAVKGNVTQLERLFSNLLENALKYTETGGKVILSAQKFKQDAVILVRDSSNGIPPEYLPFVFQWFLRTEPTRSQEADGSGLELAIAQAIARRHGGEIIVNSQVGVGSCFQVRLPLA